MTDATPGMVEMARRIADAVVENHAAAKGTHTWEIARDAALAAIIETQMRDAELAESLPVSHCSGPHGARQLIATAIRAGNHYGKDEGMRYAQIASGQRLHLVYEPGEGKDDRHIIRAGYLSNPLRGRPTPNGYRMTINVPLANACRNCRRVYNSRARKDTDQ